MLHNLNRKGDRRFSLVITRMSVRGCVPEFPWLESRYGMDESDWMILSDEGWRALTHGNAQLWEAFQRKLLIMFYVDQPTLIAIVGHIDDRRESGRPELGREGVTQILRQVRALGLPAEIRGFCVNDLGESEELVESQDDKVSELLQEGDTAAPAAPS